ncbi:hypothetical protein L1280_003099 [Deinococcus sp. HSC-46F16]|uniref:hypothetical protein n=1 Tax=Deinococcus sp. HSC-46F16 TaxID=2910968 RepID=UPI0020A0867F|nr:hypothetical protein [Deinococcus sp. HSC-46F16]MCP2015916.1 hypothetical protein [Deinococcus sp. HSC-46F16]
MNPSAPAPTSLLALPLSSLPPSRRLTVTLTSDQWVAVEAINEVWLVALPAATEPSPHTAATLEAYIPATRPTYRPVLAAARWAQDHRNDPRAQAVLDLDTTYYAAVGHDLIHWSVGGDRLWLPGVPGDLRVTADSHGPVPLDLELTPPYLTSHGLLWARFNLAPPGPGVFAYMNLWLWEMGADQLHPLTP